MTNILIRCDGNHEIGLGHIVRCLALAGELHEVHNCHIAFAMRTGPLGIQMVEEKGYQVITPPKGDLSFDYREWLNECVKKVDAEGILFDVRDGLTRAVVRELRNNGIIIVTIDDPEDKRLSADLAFYPPVPQVKRIDWTGFTGKLHIGWEWVILRKEFSIAPCPLPQAPSSISHVPKILVTMGGSDPQGMTLKAVKALEMLDEGFEAVVVLGAGSQHKKQLASLLSDCKHYVDVQEDVQDMAKLMSQSDLAVASFGLTAYELAAMGVPAIYSCLTEDHAESASIFVQAGTAVSLDVFSSVSKKDIATAIGSLLGDLNQFQSMCKQAVGLVDGRGVERIAEIIASSVTNHGSVATPELFRAEN